MNTLSKLQSQIFRAAERPDLMAMAWRLRHRVFNDTLGWEIPAIDLLEIDEFDLGATHCALTIDGQMIGYARALPTTAPYLLSSYFGDLLSSPPCDGGIWEISRFTITPKERSTALGRRLVRETILMALTCGATELIAVCEPAFRRLLMQCGLRIDVLATPKVMGQGTQGAVRAMVIGCALTARNLEAVDLSNRKIA